MSIGLPPVEVLAFTATSSVAPHAQAADLLVRLGALTLRVRGVGLLPPATVTEALTGSTTLASAATALATAYERAGWRNVLLIPVDTAPQPTLFVYETGLFRVAGSVEPLLAYFEPFVGSAPVRHSDFAIASRLAELHGLRVGVDAGARYGRSADEPAQVTMNVGGERTRATPLDYQLRLANEGNRFVGRWFGGTDLSWAADSSWRIGVGYNRVLPELGEARGDPRYDGYSAFTDGITRFGTVKLLASYARYAYEGDGRPGAPFGDPDTSPRFEASQLGIGTQIERFVFISSDWILTTGAGLTHSEYELEQTGTAVSASERASAAHVAGGARWAAPRRALRPQAYADVQLRQSLSDEFDIPANADEGFGVSSYGAGIAAELGHGRVSLMAEGQWTDDALPQSEEWVLGGLDRLSAWLPGVSVGDRGSYTRLEYQIPVWVQDRHDLKLALRAERGTSAFAGSGPAFASKLSSAGLALTYRYGRNWTLESRIATPLEEDAPAGFAIENQESDFYLRIARAFDSP